MISRRGLIAAGLTLPLVAKARGAESMEIKLLGSALVRKALNNGSPVDQAIPNYKFNPYEKLTFNQVIIDDLGAFNPANSSFVIPDGVDRAEFDVQVIWLNNVNGMRQLVIQRKSPLNVNPNIFEFFPGVPARTQMANNATTTDMVAGTTTLVPVFPGEEYAAFPLHTAGEGVSVSISGGSGTTFGAKFYGVTPEA